MLKLGIDDAGRGPVIGPMVLAGCLIDEKTEREFKKLGIKDSKQLTQKRREFLAEKIKAKAETFEIIIIPPLEIDGNGESRIKLNELEAIATAKIINRINKGYKKIKVIVDCPSTSIIKWQDFLKTKIKNLSNLEIFCEHKADKNHISVSAASVLAKCVREKEMTKLKEIYGDEIGSGYTSDLLTQKFIEKFAEKHKDKGIFRKTWITWKNAYKKIGQRKLF
ncbi:ribonuclease HII [Candidatus Pacearchaeota archaeon]|nr:ribonuclease HII [Candidatus Pacearchaeota archaeon]